MQSRRISFTVAAVLLLAATNSGWALPPLQHAISGVVEAIDCARLLRLVSATIARSGWHHYTIATECTRRETIG